MHGLLTEKRKISVSPSHKKLKTYLFYSGLQYHRGRATNHEVWVFGMVDVSQQMAMGYMEIVQDRTAKILLPIIKCHVWPNMTIHSDQWQSYSRVQMLPNVTTHGVGESFSAFCGPCHRNVESYWARVKLKFKMKGCHESQLPSYLDKFMWCERYINAESFCSAVIMLSYPLCADLEGLDQYAYPAYLKTLHNSILCP